MVYAPFGEVRAGEMSALTDFGYTGQIMDRSSGELMYYGARYYLPSLRRFISADTIVSGMSPQLLNRYTYVVNNPLRYTDPTGHRLSMNDKLWMPNLHSTVHNTPPIPTPTPPLDNRTSTLTLTLRFTQELEHYGVQVVNQSAISDLKVLTIVHDTVQTMAEKAAEVIRVATFNLGGLLTSKYEAFQWIYHSTRITIQEGEHIKDHDDWYGQNSGYTNGVAQIEIASKPFLGGEGWEAHNTGIN